MSKIRSKNTKLELGMELVLKEAGIRYLAHPSVIGKPDFLVIPGVALFCDSRFWHGKDWPRLRRRLKAGSNADYWVDHIKRNRARDRNVTAELRSAGYEVVRLWDEDIKSRPRWCVDQLESAIAYSRLKSPAKLAQ